MKLILLSLLILSFIDYSWACEDNTVSQESNFINCKKAAIQGDLNAQATLGLMYKYGLGVTRNNIKAENLIRKAAEKGNARAQSLFGTSYYIGDIVTQSDKKAVKWWRKAAEQQHIEAQKSLAIMHQRGHGTPKDHVMAYVWWNIAATNGSKAAVESRNELALKMTPSQIQEAQRIAREWVKSHW